MSDPRFENAKRLADEGRFTEALSLLKAVLQADPHDDEARAFLMELQDRMMLDLQVQEKLRKVKDLIAQNQGEQARKILHEIQRIAPDHGETQILLKGLNAPAPPPPQAFQPLEPIPATAPSELAASGSFSLEELPLMELAPSAELTAPSPPSAQPDELAPFSFDLPGESGTDQQQQLSPFSPQLGAAEIAKVQQYIREGQSHFDQGRYQDAIDSWTRVFIVDENHQTAQALIEQAKEKLTQHQAQVEHYLTEGIALFNAGESARAKLAFEKILASFPGHREAQYYLSRIQPPREAPASFPPAAGLEQEPAAAPAGGSGGFEEFELQDDLTVPTGPEMRAATEQAGEFQFDSGGDELSFAAVNPAAGSSPEATPEDFTWEEAPEAPAESAPAPPAPPFPSAAPPAPPSAPPVAEMPPQPFEAPPQVIRRPPVPAKKVGKGPGVGLVLGILAAMIVLGAGIFFGARFFLGRGETPVGPGPTPPAGPANSVQANQPVSKPEPPPPPPDPMAALSTEQLLAKGRAAADTKDYRAAITYYQEILGRDAVNPAAIDGLSQAKVGLAKQEEENLRNEKFIKSYQAALTSFQEQDYQSSLAVAWRLIYPDDTLARQLGKRESVARLITAGYYNWAVQDLKSENPREAAGKIKDLLDFDRSDGEARNLQQFTQKYQSQAPDETYRQAVRNLRYRTFSESP